ncbi:TlpA family protein disulfide reductase [Streptococcus oralis]|uniref:TlpA family protein disulfide reductase n=2 Tax=Streptococcus oralis TaxID=1303 RepID=UPI0020C8C839|nr:TlpA disulfide reductase family protein [Streptococcus oralis]MCP8923211.1 TlpA family protein disulfide reductase [Streptococcus oralis]
MKKDKWWLPFLAVGVIIALAVGLIYFTRPTKDGDIGTSSVSQSTSSDENNSALSLKGQQLPEFKMTSQDGKLIAISELYDKPILVVEWASWCPHCQKQLPIVQQMYEKYGDQIHFVLLNMNEPGKETKETADQYIKEKGYTFPYYYDEDQSAADLLQVQTIPSMYLVRKQQQVKNALVNHTTAENSSKELQELLD